MKFQLVLQWPASSMDYDRMVEVEELLIEQISEEDGEVDGHDTGSGQVNIFIHTDSPEKAFRSATRVLDAQGCLETARAAFRPIDGDEYTALWPEGLRNFRVL